MVAASEGDGRAAEGDCAAGLGAQGGGPQRRVDDGVGLGPAAQGGEGLGHVGQDPALRVEEPVPAAQVHARLGDSHGLEGAARALQSGGEVDVDAADLRDEADLDDPVADGVHLGQAAVGLPRVDEEAAEGESRVQFDVLGLDHAGVFDGPFGGGQGLLAGVVEHAPGGDVGEDLGVHLGRRQSAYEFLGGGDLGPAVAAAEGRHEAGALDPEPGGAQGVLLVVGVVDEAQGTLGDLEGAFAFAAQPASTTAASAIRSR